MHMSAGCQPVRASIARAGMQAPGQTMPAKGDSQLRTRQMLPQACNPEAEVEVLPSPIPAASALQNRQCSAPSAHKMSPGLQHSRKGLCLRSTATMDGNTLRIAGAQGALQELFFYFAFALDL